MNSRSPARCSLLVSSVACSEIIPPSLHFQGSHWQFVWLFFFLFIYSKESPQFGCCLSNSFFFFKYILEILSFWKNKTTSESLSVELEAHSSCDLRNGNVMCFPPILPPFQSDTFKKKSIFGNVWSHFGSARAPCTYSQSSLCPTNFKNFKGTHVLSDGAFSV